MSGAAQTLGSIFSPAYALFNALSGSNHDAFQLPSADKIQQEIAKTASPSPAPASSADASLSQAQAHAQQLADLEEQRSTRARLAAIQKQLLLETATAGRGYGLRTLFGSLGPPRNSVLGSG